MLLYIRTLIYTKWASYLETKYTENIKREYYGEYLRGVFREY